MRILSALKSSVLGGVDILNSLVGGPQPFIRARIVDPSQSFPDDASRRDAIAAAAELELLSFEWEGAVTQSQPNDLGDCATWQGVYTAMTVMRWKANPSPSTQRAMQEAATALSRYLYRTGPGTAILVRGAMPLSLEHVRFQVDYANAHRYFTDEVAGVAYAYREDASLDSLLGVMFGAAIVRRFGDAPSRQVLKDPLALFSTGFIRAGYKLTNRDGSPTTYGDCSPGFTQAPVRVLAAVLPDLLDDGSDWRELAATYAPEFAYTDTQVPGRIAWVNAHLAILANLAFVAAAGMKQSAPGYAEATEGLKTLLSKYEDTGNAFLVYAANCLGVRPTPSQIEKADKTLIEFPLGPKPSAGLNSSTAPSLQPVPVWQRPPVDIIWQRSPYPYSGSDSSRYSRLDYLVAHYFSRSA